MANLHQEAISHTPIQYVAPLASKRPKCEWSPSNSFHKKQSNESAKEIYRCCRTSQPNGNGVIFHSCHLNNTSTIIPENKNPITRALSIIYLQQQQLEWQVSSRGACYQDSKFRRLNDDKNTKQNEETYTDLTQIFKIYFVHKVSFRLVPQLANFMLREATAHT